MIVYQKVLDGFRRTVEPDDLARLGVLRALEFISYKKKDYEQAEGYYREELEALQGRRPEDDSDLLTVKNNLARMLQLQQKYPESAALA